MNTLDDYACILVTCIPSCMNSILTLLSRTTKLLVNELKHALHSVITINQLNHKMIKHILYTLGTLSCGPMDTCVDGIGNEKAS